MCDDDDDDEKNRSYKCSSFIFSFSSEALAGGLLVDDQLTSSNRSKQTYSDKTSFLSRPLHSQ